VVIVDLIGFGIVMPVLPFYADAFGASATTLGLLFTSYAAAQFVFAPVWGRLSDRIGRRPVMLMTVAGTALALLLLGLAPSLPWLFAARLLGGAFAANVSVASAYIADVTSDEERTRWMGMLGASFGIGFVLGPAIGGLLAPFGYAVPMLAAAALAGLNWIHAAVALKEPEGHVSQLSESAPQAGRLDVLRDASLRRLCLAYLGYSLAVTQLETVFAYFMKDRFDYGPREFAFILVAMAVLMGGIQGGGMKALSARFQERSLVVGGCLLLGFAFFVLPGAPSVALLLVPLALAAVGRAVSQPSMMSLTSLVATAETRGAAMGAFQASASLARVIGPLAAGLLYDRAQAAPFWLAGCLALAVALAGRSLPARSGTGTGSAAPPDGAAGAGVG
jgi:MFS family permease